MQRLAADEIGLGMQSLIPFQIDLVGEQPTLQLGGKIVHQQLNALLLATGETIEAAAGLQIDHCLQPLVALERETGAQACRLRLNRLPDVVRVG